MSCYELELVPFVRLGGHYGEGGWRKPAADAPGDYTSMARAVHRVVSGLPRSDLCPLYVEIWNEPNLSVEWSGETNADEYAAFFVQVAEAIRAIRDDRIKILNGGLALSPEWTEKLCKAQPGFARSFDYWSTHPYPMNRPSWFNQHNGDVAKDSVLSIDAYVLELEQLAKFGRGDAKVIITETGYDLGNSVFSRSEGHPIIDEYNRADYMVRAFRDYYPQWPEVWAVTPFEFSDRNWERFDWVYPDSGINEDGSPTRPHYQYTAVAALAKPTDEHGAINGTVTVKDLGSRLEDVAVSIHGQRFNSDPVGNYFLSNVEPGEYTIEARKLGFKEVEREVEVKRGENTVVNFELEALGRTTFYGFVKSGDTEKPLAGATVSLSPGELTTETDNGGRFRFEDVIPSKYALTASHKGHHIYQASQVEIDHGRGTRYDFMLGESKAPATENLANNPSMEAGGGGGAREGIALGFEPPLPNSFQDGDGEVNDRSAHTGRLAQMIRVRAEETVIRQITHYGTAKPGTVYMAGAWIKTDCPDRDAGAGITVDATNNAGEVVKRYVTDQMVTGRSKTWEWVAIEFEAPPGSERISLNLHTRGRGGVAYFDDVFIGPAVN